MTEEVVCTSIFLMFFYRWNKATYFHTLNEELYKGTGRGKKQKSSPIYSQVVKAKGKLELSGVITVIPVCVVCMYVCVQTMCVGVCMRVHGADQ